jgi:hypothetical protein
MEKVKTGWRIKQDGVVVAFGFGPEEAAKREAARYALTYARDGSPVHLSYRTGKRWKHITTVEIDRPAPPE